VTPLEPECLHCKAELGAAHDPLCPANIRALNSTTVTFTTMIWDQSRMHVPALFRAYLRVASAVIEEAFHARAKRYGFRH
jgi:hypothetical protein